MRLLAEFIMRGRLQASTVALIGSWIPLLSQAALGMVTLRKGWQEGLIVTAAASLPSLLGLFFGNVSSPIALSTTAVFVVAYGLAIVLRRMASWEPTLFATVALSSISAIFIAIFIPDLSGEIQSFFEGLVKESASDNPSLTSQLELLLGNFTVVKATGVIAFWVGVSALCGLIFARWLQGILYNPGGFQGEFHSIRLGSTLVLAMAATLVFCGARGEQYLYWGQLFALPLVIAGISVAHFAIAKMKLGIGAVVVMYLALVLFNPLLLVLMFVGITDTWVNYRERFKFKQ